MKKPPFKKEALFQAMVIGQDGELHPVGPRAGLDMVRSVVQGINMRLAVGQLKDWREPHIVKADF